MLKKILLRVFIIVTILLLIVITINLPKIYIYTKAIGIYGPEDFQDKKVEYFDTKGKRAAWWYYLEKDWKDCLLTNLFLSKYFHTENKGTSYGVISYYFKPSFCISDAHIKEIFNLKFIEGIIHLTYFPEDNISKDRLSNLKGLLNLTNIESLDLSNNNFSNLNDISYFKKLKKLIVKDNYLQDLQGISTLNNLEYLDCSFNNLVIPPDVSKLENLDTLVIYNNNFDINDPKIIALIKQIKIKKLVVTEKDHYEFTKKNKQR